MYIYIYMHILGLSLPPKPFVINEHCSYACREVCMSVDSRQWISGQEGVRADHLPPRNCALAHHHRIGDGRLSDYSQRYTTHTHPYMYIYTYSNFLQDSITSRRFQSTAIPCGCKCRCGFWCTHGVRKKCIHGRMLFIVNTSCVYKVLHLLMHPSYIYIYKWHIYMWQRPLSS